MAGPVSDDALSRQQSLHSRVRALNMAPPWVWVRITRRVARFSEECLSTLQFANRCRSVHNNPRVNKVEPGAAADSKKLKKLQDEIQALRQARDSLGHPCPRLRSFTGPESRTSASLLLPSSKVMKSFTLSIENNSSDSKEGSIHTVLDGHDSLLMDL